MTGRRSSTRVATLSGEGPSPAPGGPGTSPDGPTTAGDVAVGRRLDGLVTSVAVAFMAASAATLQEVLVRTLHELTEFFDVDTSFLRRNSFEQDASVLVAEWPARQDIPDPDPLGVVPFSGGDPVFAAIKDLAAPFVIRPTSTADAYQARVQQGSGVDQVSLAMVPLIRGATTVGVLGFIKFGDRPWDEAETNALQAVASLMVQLQSRVDAEERLQFHAYHDELTTLPNRRALMVELDRRRARRKPTALLYLGLDRFKTINDSLGHGAGDRLLVEVGNRLRETEGGSGFAARLAGDEFVLVLDPARGRDLHQIAERLLRTVAAPAAIAGRRVSRTASIGIAVSPSQSSGGEDLLTHADAAFRLAKRNGGNRAVPFDEGLRAAVRERSDIEVLLREAIDGTGLLLHYQPELDLRTGELLAVEALVRWDHPTRGILAAGSFIAVAEETGLIVDLGEWVMGEACRQMAVWRAKHPELRMTMRVNMSPAQLATGNIVALVASCLEANRLPGRVLCLEITEHAVMQDVDQAVRTLHELKALGVHLAMDDFGTGFSSMSQLKTLPVDTLKIDQTFVAGLGSDRGDRAIVDATVRLATSFGLEVVAEGVETVELVHELLALGCHRAQGYLLSRPKPPAELALLIAGGGVDPVAFTAVPPLARPLAPAHPRRRATAPAPALSDLRR